MIPFTAELIESFAGAFLSPLYDDPVPTPEFHRECWRLYCSTAKQACVAAPRKHAKSTALTHDYVLATALFRVQSYIVLISSNEEMAIEHLGDIAHELRENEDLIAEFGIKEITTDAKTDIIVECTDGYEFRIIARGSGQKMRGRKWKGKRPGLVVCDDLEDDEQVENRDQRAKFRRWFLRALKPVLRSGGQIRVHGTILHEDSLLSRLMTDRTWQSKLYKAHAGFDDFTDILWPESWPETRLREERQGFIEQQDPSGYSQEYLNDPFDNSEAYLRRGDFLPMRPDDYDSSKIICAAADFAISKADKANRTSLTMGGKDVNNTLHFLDQRVGRWDALEICEEIFSFHARWNPDVFFVEGGQIWLSLWPTLKKEMQARNRFINFDVRTPIRDKASRGRAYQRRMRAGACRFDKTGEWYPGFEAENLRFTGLSEATLDDQFDSAALLALGFEDLANVEEEDLMEEDEMEMINSDPRKALGRSPVTGY
jgi:hypothetical protein